MSPFYDPSELLSIAQAAEALGVSIWTVYRWAQKKVIDSVEVAGLLCIPKKEVDKKKSESSRTGSSQRTGGER